MHVERERLLDQARAAGSLAPVAQRNAVKGLIRDCLWSRTCTPMEILQAAYGDPEGHRYWELWLFEPLRVYTFADLLAAHLAAADGGALVSVNGVSIPVLDGYQRQVFEALRAATHSGETWFRRIGEPDIAVRPRIRHSPLWQLRWVKGGTFYCFPEKPSRGCVATQMPDIWCRQLLPRWQAVKRIPQRRMTA